jgi:hypothetical protein
MPDKDRDKKEVPFPRNDSVDRRTRREDQKHHDKGIAEDSRENREKGVTDWMKPPRPKGK